MAKPVWHYVMLFERLEVENTPQNPCFEPKRNFLKAEILENQSQNQKAKKVPWGMKFDGIKSQSPYGTMSCSLNG